MEPSGPLQACNGTALLKYVMISVAAGARAGASGLFACWDCGFESRQRHGCLSLVIVVCCQEEVCLIRADHSSRGVLMNFVCLSMIVKPRKLVWSWPTGGRGVLLHHGKTISISNY